MFSDNFSSESTEFDAELYTTIYEESVCVVPGTGAVLKFVNDDENPIKGAFMGGVDGKRPELVIAVVQPEHLKTGIPRRYTQSDKELAAEIRNRGIRGISGIADDQCGHVISYNLGGQMQYENLFPQGKTSNLTQYLRMESAIEKFVGSTNRTKPWALILVRLFYNNNNYPNRPTNVCYSYFLYEEKEGKSIANIKPETDSPILMPVLPIGIKISVEGCVNVSSRQRVAPNRVKVRSNAESQQLWESLAIGFQAVASLVTLIGSITISKPAISNPTPDPVSVDTPVAAPQPAPIPVPVPIHEPVPLEIWSEQI